eukprot:1186633-Prorocentrum_minimum.AAC.3
MLVSKLASSPPADTTRRGQSPSLTEVGSAYLPGGGGAQLGRERGHVGGADARLHLAIAVVFILVLVVLVVPVVLVLLAVLLLLLADLLALRLPCGKRGGGGLLADARRLAALLPSGVVSALVGA